MSTFRDQAKGYLGRCHPNPGIIYIYRISSVIRQSFFFFQNNPNDLDPSCKMDLDLLDCLGRVNLVL